MDNVKRVKNPRCAIINRNYPPDPGITGQSAAELVGYLEAVGIAVTIITVEGRYAGGVQQCGNTTVGEHLKVRALYNGKNKLLRLIGTLIEGWRLARLIRCVKPDVIIGMTDPPLLNYWISKSAGAEGIPWISWSMDLYPEAFVAAGLVSSRSFVFRRLANAIQKRPPAHLIALGPAQAKHIQQDFGYQLPFTILPCGVHSMDRSAVAPSWHPGQGKVVFGYVGNMGEAHDPEFVISVMRALDPRKHVMVLAVYGVHGKKCIAAAELFESVRVVNQVSREELGWIDVHVTSLNPKWDHVCVPSKAVSAVCSGGALITCSSDLNDNWILLQDAAWRIPPGCDYSVEIPAIVRSLSSEDLCEKRLRAKNLAEKLQKMRADAFEDVRRIILELVAR